MSLSGGCVQPRGLARGDLALSIVVDDIPCSCFEMLSLTDALSLVDRRTGREEDTATHDRVWSNTAAEQNRDCGCVEDRAGSPSSRGASTVVMIYPSDCCAAHASSASSFTNIGSQIERFKRPAGVTAKRELFG